MKKKLLLVLFPVVLTLVFALGSWANVQTAVQPCCAKAVKPAQTAGCNKCAKAGTAAQGCDNCVQGAQAGQGCDKCAANQAGAGQGCDKCVKLKAADAKPCGGGNGCGNCAKMQQAGKIQQDETKPCCNKMKP